MANPLHVGIDVHSRTNRVCLLDQAGQPWGRRFSVPNNRPGSQVLRTHLLEALRDGQFDRLRLAVEATNWYWLPLFQALQQDPLLQAWPLTLFAFNPRGIAKYKESFADLDKTDDSDAFVIADRLRMGHDLPHPFELDAQHLALRFLTRYRHHLVRDLVREKNYTLGLLYLKASEWRPQHPFADVFGTTSQSVLLEFASCDEIAALPLADLAARLDTYGKGRFPDPVQVARTLQQICLDSYPLDSQLQQPIHYVLNASFHLIQDLERNLQRIDTAITDAMAAIPHTLQTIPGLGPVYAAGLIAEIGDLARFDHNEAKVAQFAGFHWRRTQSDKFDADDTPLTKRGNAYLRYYFCEAANTVRMRDADYAAYYQRKHDEVRTHQHRRALVLTARKLVRLVVRLLTTNQPYQPRKVPDA